MIPHGRGCWLRRRSASDPAASDELRWRQWSASLRGWAAEMIRRQDQVDGDDNTPMDLPAGDDDSRAIGCAHTGDGDPRANGCARMG